MRFVTKAMPISYYINAKQKYPGCKKIARPIRSSPIATYVRPLISAEAKKSPIKDVSNYLNDMVVYFVLSQNSYCNICSLAYSCLVCSGWPH